VAVHVWLRFLVLAAFAAGCSLIQPFGIEGRTFLSTAVSDGGQARNLVAGTVIRLTFGSDGHLGASAGCNSFGATYRLDGAVLRIEGGAMTDMGCDPDRMAQDQWLFAFLGAGPAISLTGNDLMLRSGELVIRLVDREVAEPDLPLVGPTWTVVSIVSGDAVSSVPEGAIATLAFGADGHFQVNTGCNAGGGTYVVDGASLRFADLVTTKKACMGAAGALENAVRAVLGADSATVAIDASTLSLRAGNAGLDLSGS
jgi:heat shock protein HslJ